MRANKAWGPSAGTSCAPRGNPSPGPARGPAALPSAEIDQAHRRGPTGDCGGPSTGRLFERWPVLRPSRMFKRRQPAARPRTCSSHHGSTPGPLIPVVAACVKDARPSRWLAPLERPRWPQHRPRVAPPADPSLSAVESVELAGGEQRRGQQRSVTGRAYAVPAIRASPGRLCSL